MAIPTPTTASKVFRQVRAAVTMEGIWTVLSWLLEFATFVVCLEHVPKGKCIAVIHKDNLPENDEYINIDIRVMGRTVLTGWIQLL
jgi:hypothetical protein